MSTPRFVDLRHGKFRLVIAMAIAFFPAASSIGFGFDDLNPAKIISNVLREASKGVSDLGGAALNLVESGIEGVDTVIQGGQKTIQKFGDETLTTISKTGEGAFRALQKVNGDAMATLEKAGKDTVTTVSKAGKDVVMNYVKGWRDVGEQSRVSFDDAVEAGEAAIRYSKRTIDAQYTALSSAERRLREGKAIDAVWGMAIEPLQAQEDNFFKATQESKIIAQAAATAAATYGGPGGAAAFAAWSTYRSTGDANLALRVGIISGLSSQLSAGQTTLPANSPLTDVAKRTALAGAAGGIAVASQGGDEDAIKNGFMKSAGNVLIQYGKDSISSFDPKAADGVRLVECISGLRQQHTNC
jgi:hypothetical protein